MASRGSVFRGFGVAAALVLLAGAAIAAPAPQSKRAVRFGVTPPVSELASRPGVVLRPTTDKNGVPIPVLKEINPNNTKIIKRPVAGNTAEFTDPTLAGQRPEATAVMPTPFTFDGVNSTTGILPPDTVGDVGPNHYVQNTNSSTTAITAIGIYDKTLGTLLVPVFSMSTLFASIGGPCAGSDDGDPITLYDSFADRWFISQFSIGTTPSHQCIAISQTGDPTGAYYAYDFVMPNDKLNDYPHFGVWHDAYYMTDNQFTTGFEGGGVFAFDRAKMIAGDPTASYIYFDIFDIDPNAGGMLPSDADGFVPPPAALPQLIMEWRADDFGDPIDALRFYEFVPDFAVPANSTLTVQPDLALAGFDARNPSGRGDIEQLGGANLDSIADRLMHRLQYRNVGTLAAPQNRWTGNFSVNVSGVNPTTAATFQSAPRWFILQSAGTALPTVLDQGTHSPDAGNGATGANRWMGSAALDWQGNLAIGFSRSSTTGRADIVIAGRLAGDAAGSLVQGEAVMFAAAGSQTSTSNRWGDYSSMNVDPIDDCTFWYTQEYYSTVSGANWRTRIGSFIYPGCTAAPHGTVQVNVTNCSTNAPILGASVAMTGGFFNTTDAAGDLLSDFLAGAGSYTVTSSKTGYLSGPGSTAPAVVSNGGTTVVNVCLAPVAIPAAGTVSIVSESCTPANTALDPGEAATLSICVVNSGTADTINLVGTLQASGGVTLPGAAQNYGIVLAGGPAVCRSFPFTVDGALTCGGSVTPTVQLQDGATNYGNLAYPAMITGALTGPVVTNTFSFTGPAQAIPDGGSTVVNLLVSGIAAGSQVTDVNFRFDTGGACTNTVGDVNAGLDHTWVGDVIVTGVAPTSESVTIIDQIGVPASTFGLNAENFCATTLDDEGGFPPIENTALNPVAGNFSPNNPLSGFDTVSAPNGNWVFTFADGAAGDTGSVRRFSLVLETTGRVCSTTCAVPCSLTCPANVTTGNAAGACNAAVNYPAPTTVGACATVTCAAASGSLFPVGVNNVTCSDSGSAATCGFSITVNDIEPAVVTPATCPAVDLFGPAGPLNYTPPTATDNCNPTVTGSCTPPPGSIFPTGTTTISCSFPGGTATDSTCSYPLTLNGSVIEVPALSGAGLGSLIALLAGAAVFMLIRKR